MLVPGEGVVVVVRRSWGVRSSSENNKMYGPSERALAKGCAVFPEIADSYTNIKHDCGEFTVYGHGVLLPQPLQTSPSTSLWWPLELCRRDTLTYATRDDLTPMTEAARWGEIY